MNEVFKHCHFLMKFLFSEERTSSFHINEWTVTQFRDIFCWIRFRNCIFPSILLHLYVGGKRHINRIISTFHRDFCCLEFETKTTEGWNKITEIRNIFWEIDVNYVYISHFAYSVKSQYQNKSADMMFVSSIWEESCYLAFLF